MLKEVKSNIRAGNKFVTYNNVYVPCGKCYACKTNAKNQWVFRLQVEEDNSKRCYFITLTLNDQNLHDLKKLDLQNFFRYLRKKGHEFKYYAIGEYGSHTKRPHYHVALFLKSQTENNIVDHIQSIWNYGYTQVSELNIKRINYVLHYHIRPKEVNGKKTFALMSKGLGNDIFQNEQIINRAKENSCNNININNRAGNSTFIPRYYRKKYNIPSSSGAIIKDIGYNIHELKEKNNFNYRKSLISLYKDKMLKYNLQEKF